MKALVVEAPAQVDVVTWTDPAAADGETVIEPLLVGLCGTDLELIDGSIDPAYVRYPLVLGHEWVGRTLADGPAGLKGTRVLVEGIVPCGECPACLRGATNLCDRYDEVGFTRPGAAAGRVAVPTRLIHTLDPSVTLEDAVFAEPAAVVWRALTRIPLRAGLRVAVVGDGTVALLAALLVRSFLPESVNVFGRRDTQRDLVAATGADGFSLEPPTSTYDLVIEAAGVVESVGTAVTSVARGGMIILLGLPPHGSTVSVAPDDLVNNDVLINASFSYTRDSFAEVVEELNSGRLHPSFLLTHRFVLKDAHDAIATLRDGGGPAPRGKIAIDISSRSS